MVNNGQNLKKRSFKSGTKDVKKQNNHDVKKRKVKGKTGGGVLTKTQKAFLNFLKQFTYPKVYGVGAMAGVCLLLIMYISAKYTPFGESANYQELIRLIDETPVASFIIAIFPPILEEFICRKVIFGFLKKYSKLLAYGISSVVFTLGHYQFSVTKCYEELNTTPTYFISGLVLAYTYNSTGYLLSSMFAHYINNGGIALLRTLGLWLNN